jgi:glycosyltransferase involved in cell wall biosynthesis
MPVRTHPSTVHASPARTRVLYFTRIDFPSPKANSIQTLHTCYEMARAGADVMLVVRKLLQSRRDCFAYYGLPEHPRLRFVSLSLPVESEFNEWRGRYFSFYLQAFLRRHGRSSTLLVTRDPAGLELLRQVRGSHLLSNLCTLFEVHKLSFITKASHQEERGRSLADPEVRAKVEARRRLEAEVYGSVNGLVCTSSGALQLLEQHFPDHAPACVLPNGTRIPEDANGEPRVAAILDDAGRDLDIVYVGQLYRWKGIDGLLRALAHLPQRKLTLVGGHDSQDMERCRSLAAELGITHRVEFVGQLPPYAVGGYLERARVGVVPLPRDGFVEAERFTSPLKIFELMSAGVPIVTSDLPSIRELVQDQVHALLVPPDDPRALACGLETLLEDRRLAGRLVAAAASHVLEFTWEARARRLLEFAAGLQAECRASGE